MPTRPHPGMPLWVRLAIGVAGLVVVAVIAAHLFGFAPMHHSM